MAVDDGIFGIFNGFGEALFAVGMIGALICGVAIAAVAEVPLKAAGANPMRTDCWFVLIVCAWLHLIPVVNLFPVMAIWCLYVALAT